MSLKIGETIQIQVVCETPFRFPRVLRLMAREYQPVTIENDKQLAKYSAMLGSKSVQAKAGQ